MSHVESLGIRLDEHLEELTARIVERIRFDPSEKKAKLQPPHLRVVKGPHGVNSYCVPRADGTKMILVGADLYPFFHHYARAAAAYFLQSEPSGGRPSAFWPQAQLALATTLDWLSSPSPFPLYQEFELTPRQTHIAKAFGDYTYRFAICHEIAHVVLGHLDAGPTEVRTMGDGDLTVFQASHQQEFDADQFGFELHVKSLPDPTMLHTAIASAIYFVHITGLLDGRLMLLAHLVDAGHWKIANTHPPAIARVFKLMSAANGVWAGAGHALVELHSDLSGLDAKLYDAANKQQEEVAAATGELVRRMSGRGKSRKGSTSEVKDELLRLFARSPLGVMRALEPAGHADNANKDKLALELPSEFQRFRGQTPAERAAESA
jgi:hypothetical protein